MSDTANERDSRMTPLMAYGIVLAAYLPGLVVIVRRDLFRRLPIIATCFLSFFIFDAVGSYSVFTLDPIGMGYMNFTMDLMEPEYIGMLVAQALLAYVCLGPYLAIRRTAHYVVKVQSEDKLMCYVVALIIFIAMLVYRREVGDFLVTRVSDLTEDIGALRQQYLFGQAFSWLYWLGFCMLPVLLAIQLAIYSLA